MKRLVILLTVLASVSVLAQAPPNTLPSKPPEAATIPTLTELQKKDLDIALLERANAEQAMQLAQINFKNKHDAAVAFVGSLEKEGFTFDLNTKTYAVKVK